MILSIIGIAFLVFMMLRVPVSISIGAAVLVALNFSAFSTSTYIIPQQIIEGAGNPTLLAIPFFIMTGNLMNASGMTDRIFNFANALVGHMRAGLAQVNVVSSMIFAGISGAAVADCAGLGRIEIKAMRDRGYPAPFAGALTVASAVIGPLIPPSLGLIIYSFLSSTSVARLFLGGIVPGLLVAASLMIYNAFVLDVRKLPKPEKRSWSSIRSTAIDGIAALVAPGFILAAIVGGFVTPTEAGIIASFYSLVLGLIYRSLSLAAIWHALTQTVFITAVIMMIIGFSTAMGWLITIEQTPQMLAQSIIESIENPFAFIAVLLIFLIIIGAFVEGIPAMLILVPVLLPAVDAFGIDRIHFGLIIQMALLIGIATPPMGIGLYIVSEVGQIKFEALTMAIIPFVFVLIAVLFLIAFVPQSVLFLPDLILGPQ